MERVIGPRAAAKLLERAPLPVDPARSIAVKRDVHEFEVETDAATFARAFREVVEDPGNMFGLIRVKRPAGRLGRAFEPGERFQGCFSLEHGVVDWFLAGRLRFLAGLVRGFLGLRPAARAVAWVEDQMLSNYAEIVEIRMDPPPGEARRLHYRYLDGTPIAGSSVFTIEALAPRRCRLTQVFQFQEVNAIALATFERFGLKFHDQVVYMQVHQAARRAGARVLRGTIPERYGEMGRPWRRASAAASSGPAPVPGPAASGSHLGDRARAHEREEVLLAGSGNSEA